MSQRIRYKEESPGIFRSRKSYISSSTGASYKILLDVNQMIFKIQNLNTLLFIYVGGENINNLNVLKRTAKSVLENKFKVKFCDEVRQRTYGLCEKGWTQDKELQKRIDKLQEKKTQTK